MSQNIYRPVDYDSLHNQSDITLGEEQVEDIVVIPDDKAKKKIKNIFLEIYVQVNMLNFFSQIFMELLLQHIDQHSLEIPLILKYL